MKLNLLRLPLKALDYNGSPESKKVYEIRSVRFFPKDFFGTHINENCEIHSNSIKQPKLTIIKEEKSKKHKKVHSCPSILPYILQSKENKPHNIENQELQKSPTYEKPPCPRKILVNKRFRVLKLSNPVLFPKVAYNEYNSIDYQTPRFAKNTYDNGESTKKRSSNLKRRAGSIDQETVKEGNKKKKSIVNIKFSKIKELLKGFKAYATYDKENIESIYSGRSSINKVSEWIV